MKSYLKLLVILVLAGCSSPKQNETVVADTLVNFTVKAAPEWTEMFYQNDGWFGADGIFEMTLKGNESIGAGSKDSVLMYFSDTMTGQVVGDSSVKNFKMINNSFAWITGLNPSKETVNIFFNKDKAGQPSNYFNPQTTASKPNEYFWFGDGFVNQEDNNSINIFGYRTFDKSAASWDFEIRGVVLITVPSGKPFSAQTQIDLPLFLNKEGIGTGTFGSGIYVNTKGAGAPDPDGYLYVYGVLDSNKQLVVARVKPSAIKDISSWRFWNGVEWDAEIENVKPVTDRVSNEISITPMKDGRYLLVFQADGIGTHTAVRIGKSPVGPFGPLQKIWLVPELQEPPGIIPYNAKAHPVLSHNNKLLISYNTISLDYFNDILKYPHMYRPRFFWLELPE